MENQMKERPIIFNGDMVRAILEGRKTQTRRVVKPQPYELRNPPGGMGLPFATYQSFYQGITATRLKCPYGEKGDRLWVRETFQIESNARYQDVYSQPDTPLGPVHYFKDGGDEWFECPRYKASEPDTHLGEDEKPDPWKPSIHMPRWASRITLEVTGVRVERLQEISERDAEAEGIDESGTKCIVCGEPYACAVDGFACLWDSINSKRGYSWDSNPWVWVIEFKREASPPDAGYRYRLLNDGDTLEIGDEMLLDDAVTWETIGEANTVASRWMIGATYRAQIFMPAGRKIFPANAQSSAAPQSGVS